MQTSLKNVTGNQVVAYFVWLPCIRSDSRNEAIQRVSEFDDPRVHNYWDENRVTGTAWQQRLGLPSFAWDVYFLFDQSTTWLKEVPQPTFWMHQLSSAQGKAPFLDEEQFQSQLKTMVAKKK
jgi:hypothetical protein